MRLLPEEFPFVSLSFFFKRVWLWREDKFDRSFTVSLDHFQFLGVVSAHGGMVVF
jgi:hypothetical protein